MKKFLLPFVGLLFMASCNDNAEVVEESCLDFEFETQATSSNLDYIQQRIGMEHPQTRVGETVSIEPYVYEGDTVMYIVNYEDGWELYSNDTSVPMVLGSAETGHFDTELDIFKAYIDGVVETLHSRFSNRSRIRSVYSWHGTDKNGNDALLYDEDGNVRGYKYQCYRFDNITDYHFQMNWGWGRDYYDNIWLTRSLEVTPDYTGNLAFTYTGFNIINSGL